MPLPSSHESQFEQWTLPPLHRCLYLTGPTGSGKTPLAISLAERLGAEIISLDSMAIYREMDIGTAKPSRADRQRVPHHLIDILPPTESFSVSSYALAAHQTAKEITERGKSVLFCGGTPLYLKSLIRGLFLGPEADWDFRNAVEADLKQHGQAALRARLEQVDPLSAHKIHPHDHRRIIRALEVARVTGKPLSHWQQQFETPAPRELCPVVVLRLDRAWLHSRINARVDAMFQQGLVSEVEGLLAKYTQLGRTAAQAVGYREVIEYLQLTDRTDADLQETLEQIKAHTRQFARRQEIWFRGLSELQPLPVSPEASHDDLVDQLSNMFEHSFLKGGHADR